MDRPDAGPAQRPIGVLYLDSRERGRLLSPATQRALEAFATEAAAAIESARLYRESAEKARLEQDLQLAAEIQRALLPQAQQSGSHFEVACRFDSLPRHRRRLLRLFQPAGWSLRLCARRRGGEGAVGGASHGDDSGHLCLPGQHGGIRGRVDVLRERGPDSPVRSFAVCHLRVRARWRRTDA